MAEKTEAQLFTIEELRQRLNIPAAACAGAMTQQGWGAGKQVGEKEFSAAVAKFLAAPIRGGAR